MRTFIGVPTQQNTALGFGEMLVINTSEENKVLVIKYVKKDARLKTDWKEWYRKFITRFGTYTGTTFIQDSGAQPVILILEAMGNSHRPVRTYVIRKDSTRADLEQLVRDLPPFPDDDYKCPRFISISADLKHIIF